MAQGECAGDGQFGDDSEGRDAVVESRRPEQQKRHSEKSECPGESDELLGAEDGVLRGFGHAELDDAFGGNLDFRAGGGVAPHAGFAVHEHQFAEARQGEGVLGVLVGQLGDVLENFTASTKG